MKIEFKGLSFVHLNDEIFAEKIGNIEGVKSGFTEIQIAGENNDTHMGIKAACSSEARRLKYLSHKITDDELIITQKSDIVEAKTVFKGYEDSDAVRIYTEVKNISGNEIILEEVSAFTFSGIGVKGEEGDLYFTRFTQSHHYECQPIRRSFKDYGLNMSNGNAQKRICFANVGSWSTKEELPQGIIEQNERFLMFEIENNNSWYYEIGDNCGKYYLYLGGANLPNGGWEKTLKPNESYKTVSVALSFGNSLNEVIGEMTKYRRHIAGKCKADENLPAIFNEYMHLSWDSPTEENTRKVAEKVAETGVKYYVIDCGWHDEEDGNIIYPYVGKWKESKKRFPHGVKATTDYIRSLGMKAGLWIEPEIIGVKCKEMLDYYDDDCFITRHGKKIAVMDRYFLDFRAKKVVEYMTETVRRMIEEYGADYIKLDYNEDMGIGTDKYGTSYGEGLEECARAYLKWIDDIQSEFPDVLFETCSSGGMRMDYGTLSHFSIVSTSDQADYLKYPYIAGNILSAVLPEQAAVWAYPVGVGEIGKPLSYDADWIKENITDERIIMNMINSFLGRMHLASHIELLSEEQFALVKEGVDFYNCLIESKKRSVPYFPFCFTDFSKQEVASGYIADNVLYLAVWNLDRTGDIVIPLGKEWNILSVKIGYPVKSDTKYLLLNNELSVHFDRKYCARFFVVRFTE